MSLPNYDDPALEEQWCNERRAEVAAYLQRERVPRPNRRMAGLAYRAVCLDLGNRKRHLS